MRYHIIAIHCEAVDFEAAGLPDWVANIRAVWDRKLGGHGIVRVDACGSKGCGRLDEKYIDLSNSDEDRDPDEKVFAFVRDHIDLQSGRVSCPHHGVEDEVLPEFAGGRPSQSRALDRLIERISSELKQVNDEIWEMCNRMRYGDFDGDFDPNETNKRKRTQLQAQLDALHTASRSLPDDRSAFERSLDDDADEEANLEAEMRNEDKHTRFCEGGWVDAGIYDSCDDRDD